MCACACAPVCACAYACPLRRRPWSSEAHAPMLILTARCQMADAGVSCRKGPSSGGKQHVVEFKDRHGSLPKRYSTVPPLAPAAAAAATHVAAHARTRWKPGPSTPACYPSACLLPRPRCHHSICLLVQDPAGGEDDIIGHPGTQTAGQPGSRTIGQSARPVTDLDPDGQNNVPVPDQSDGPTRRLHVAGE